MPEEPRCPECGFSIYSRIHLEGVGVHDGTSRKVDSLEGGVTVTSSRLATSSITTNPARGTVTISIDVQDQGIPFEPAPAPKPGLGAMSFKELKATAEALGLTVRVGTSKARLIEMLS